MEKLKSIINELLSTGKANLVIGFRNGINNEAIPLFIDNSSKTELTVYDERCKHNLAHFLYKKEVAEFKKLAIITDIRGVKSIIQLLAEHQLANSEITAIIPENENNIVVLSNSGEFEKYAENNPVQQSKEDKEFIEKINSMPREQRWDFWVSKLSECIKCYSCRAACPLCYCNRCAIEENRPQWIKISSGAQGNMEWHISHAMHLAGRCVECGECSRACPAEIPVHIFTSMLNKSIEEQYNLKPGIKVKSEYALNTYKPDDKENFIR